MKKENGMGLVALVLIVIAIIAIVIVAVFFTNEQVVDNSLENVKTDMLLIQGKLKIIEGSVEVNSKENTLKGSKLADLKESDEQVKEILAQNILGEKGEEYYRLGRTELDDMGLNSVELKENQYYFVHYTDKEVVTNLDVKDTEGNVYHKLSELLAAEDKEAEVNETEEQTEQVEENKKMEEQTNTTENAGEKKE